MKKLTILFVISLLLTGAGCTFKKSVSLNDVIDAPEVEDIQEQPIDDAQLDSDNDGLTNAYETNTSKTDPYNSDTDGDGYSDGQEIEAGYDPNEPAQISEATKEEINTVPIENNASIEVKTNESNNNYVDCGSDTDCFNQRFGHCSPASVSSEIEGFATVMYQINGWASSGSGCEIVMVYLDNINPEWELQTMYCNLDNSQDFEVSITETLNEALKTDGICWGDLNDTIHAD